MTDESLKVASWFRGDNVDTKFNVKLVSTCESCQESQSWSITDLPSDDWQLPVLDWHATHGQMHDESATEKGQGTRDGMIDDVLRKLTTVRGD